MRAISQTIKHDIYCTVIVLWVKLQLPHSAHDVMSYAQLVLAEARITSSSINYRETAALGQHID